MLYQVGDTIGRYTIVEELGEGSFGKVYLVDWLGKKGKKQGALKILKDPKFKDILEEVSTWARVSHHPNILTFIGATEYDKRILLISECASEGTLEDWIETHAGKKEFIESAVKMMIGVLCGLEHLHSNDIVHRDIKPANILLKNKTPLLADFGLSRGLDLVQSSILAGTLAYMSPELITAYFSQKMGNPIDFERTEADDLWASAATLYQMCVGDLPFKSINDIISSSPSPLPSHMPKELCDVVERALQKDISRRFQTAKEMREGVEKCWHSIRQQEENQTIHNQVLPEKEGQMLVCSICGQLNGSAVRVCCYCGSGLSPAWQAKPPPYPLPPEQPQPYYPPPRPAGGQPAPQWQGGQQPPQGQQWSGGYYQQPGQYTPPTGKGQSLSLITLAVGVISFVTWALLFGMIQRIIPLDRTVGEVSFNATLIAGVVAVLLGLATLFSSRWRNKWMAIAGMLISLPGIIFFIYIVSKYGFL